MGHVCPELSTTTTFNSNVENMVQGRTNDQIVIVDMECSAGLNYLPDMADTLHPNSTGYAKMANKWFADGLLKILPQTDAGTDQSVDEKTLVTLDGSGSDDPDGVYLYYLWNQLSPGITVTLSDPSNKKPTFIAPAVGSIGERLEFELTVTDVDGFVHSYSVFIHINNVLLPPVAEADPDHVIEPGITVTLNGSDSYDPDGTISSVLWEQISGNPLVDLTTPTDLTAPAVDTEEAVLTLTFKLTVKYNDDLVSEDIVNVTVTHSPAVVSAASSSGGGGCGCFIQSVMNRF